VRHFMLSCILILLLLLPACFPAHETVDEPIGPLYYDPGYYVPYGSLDTFVVNMYNNCSDIYALDVYLDGTYQLTVNDYNALYIPRGNYNFYIVGQQEVFVDPEVGYQYFTYSDDGRLYVDGDIDWTVCEYY
jgi:hypothetical protein